MMVYAKEVQGMLEKNYRKLEALRKTQDAWYTQQHWSRTSMVEADIREVEREIDRLENAVTEISD